MNIILQIITVLAVFPIAARGVEVGDGWDFPIFQVLATIEAYRKWEGFVGAVRDFFAGETERFTLLDAL